MITNFDILSYLITYLSTELNVNVSTEIPEDLPDTFISIKRNGGNTISIHNDMSVITMQCWALSEVDAYALMQRLRKALDKLSETSVCVQSIAESSIRINNPQDKKHRRYEGVFSLISIY